MRRRAVTEEARTRGVSVRLSASAHAAVLSTAKTTGIPAGRLARVLITYGLTEFARDN